ncbi:MAG: phosphoribosyl transferase [Actinobacteria bacterium HGW-Actinobacteria-4]|nr:MAG: phosphoribosyl transferase [Actinobacteria bacterium HGW-Actinobacteria-4]
MPEFVERYANRTHAGRVLAHFLSLYAGRDDVLVLALPRGGAPVAAPIAEALGAQLELAMVRKLGLPGQPEVAMGAIADLGGAVEVVQNREVIDAAGVTAQAFDDVYVAELEELRRRDRMYREGRPAASLRERAVIIVDDGLATGATARAAVQAARALSPARVIVAAPVGTQQACRELRESADEVFCPLTPAAFHHVGQWYDDFGAVTDEQVQDILRAHSEFDPDPRVSMP